MNPPWKKNNATNITGMCTIDVKACDDGTILQRQQPSCEFPACPIKNNSTNTVNTTNVCPNDKKNCWGAGNVSRIPPSCEFESCAKYGIPPNTCNYRPDCKIVMSMCSCEAVPIDDPRDWINGSYCPSSECVYKDKLIATAICENNVCVKVIDNNSVKGSLYITTSPSAANIYLNTNYKGTSPLLISDLSLGEYSLEAVLNSAGRNMFKANVTNAMQTNVYVILTPTCIDSDNGINYGVSGTAQVNYNSITNSAQDACNDLNVTEQYCEYPAAVWINSTDYSCPSGCLNGACLP